MTPQAAMNRLIERRELFHDEMLSLMRQIMTGEVTPVQIAGILLGLRVKGETVTEIAAAATVMRELSSKVVVANIEHLVDTCGTGGDGAHTFNISTTSAFVAAAAGVKIAKHGGRSVSNTCGSADVLEGLGVYLNITPEQVAECINTLGVGFMFAPNHHSAMKHAAPVRRELGVRTLFNILGPLTNPAGAHNQVMGVFHADLVGIQARVLQMLGSRHVLIVHGEDGMDEISLCANTLVAELRHGSVVEYTLDPREYGFSYCEPEALKALDAPQAQQMLRDVLKNTPGAPRDIVCLNAGAAIYVSGIAENMAEGIKLAQTTLASGAARRKLDELIALSTKFRPA